MAVHFGGFAAYFQPRLTSAHQRVLQVAQTSSQAITAGRINWPAYRKWFDAAGNTNPHNARVVRQTINRILSRLPTTDITFIN